MTLMKTEISYFWIGLIHKKIPRLRLGDFYFQKDFILIPAQAGEHWAAKWGC